MAVVEWVDIVKRNRSHVVGRTPALRPLVVGRSAMRAS